MRLAVFTSKFPARVSTFFERDMRALIEAGIEIDVFPIYPLDESMWDYSPETLNEQVLARDKIHHLSFGHALKAARPYPLRKVGTYLSDVVATTRASLQYGVGSMAKTAYVLAKSWAWAREHQNQYDHVLAYWGNFAATCAYSFHRLLDRPIPFSIWLHAGADLYDTPIYLKEKLLYADQIITCCAFNRKYLAEHFTEIFPAISDKINVCYHGLNFPDFPYQPNGHHPNKIVAVGRLAKEKGFSYLVQAAHELKALGTPVELEFVGDGEELPDLKALAQELNLTELVHFRGWLKFKDVQKAIADATMLVHPSDGLGDGLPNVIREAMALGTPVIASDIAGIHEALDHGKCGILVAPRDVAALVSSITSLLTDEGRRKALADLARKRAEAEFDMWENGRNLASILQATKRREPPAQDVIAWGVSPRKGVVPIER